MILTTMVAKTDIFNFRVSFPIVIVMRDGIEFSIFGAKLSHLHVDGSAQIQLLLIKWLFLHGKRCEI